MGLFFLFMLMAGLAVPIIGFAAPYAAFVMDARTGEVIHSRNADTRLHPASLTKMMTLYVAFTAIQRGEITLDTEVRITAEAAGQPCSCLGLREGQVIRLRYLLRAAAVKSANDAATAIGIAIGGSEAAYAERMNATARAMGMSNTHFVNMNGLTQEGHYSTARDMSVLGRHVIYDFPQYYNLFSRRTADAGIAQVNNTNTRFLDSYEGADGIKTGYTVAAGYNLVASAERDGVRIIATVFGGTSTANRNARVAELLDMGFAAAPRSVTPRAPEMAPVEEADPAALAALVAANTNAAPGGLPAGRTIRVTGQVEVALRPQARPGSAAVAVAATAATVPGVDDAVNAALAEALGLAVPDAPAAGDEVSAVDPATTGAVLDEITHLEEVAAVAVDPGPTGIEIPPERPAEIIMTAEAIALTDAEPAATELVTRVSTAGGRHWGINVGRFNSRGEADRLLIQVAVAEAAVLDGGVRRIVQRSGGYDANIMGLTREAADLACRRLQARDITCFTIGTD